MSRARTLLPLLAFIALTLGVAALGGVFTAMGQPEWYDSLAKPSFNPPSWVFGPVWTTLYVLMAVAAWLVWTRVGAEEGRSALIAWAVQLVLNLGWSALFFGLRSPGWALAEIALLWAAILLTTILFLRHSRAAGWLMVPYLAWVSFAAVLNFSIVRLNDAADADARAPSEPASIVGVEPLATPAPPGSAEPEVTAGPGGVYLSWLEAVGGDRYALRFSRLDDDGWTEPGTVMERDGLFVNWADFPSLLALGDGTLAAHWLEKSGPGTYAYDVRMARSTDGGVSWSRDVIPHRDGIQAEHGFVSLFPAGESTVGVVWLDGRATVEGQPMTLRYATMGPEGASAETLLDASVCDCCQTGAALAGSGPVVVYRDRTADEVRDIYVVRQTESGWSEPAPVHRDGWVIPACPVNGPVVAARGDRVVVAWFTGAPSPRVQVAFSDDGGASFGPPVRVDEGAGQGRVDLVLLDDGTALVSWLERTSDGAQIRYRQVARDRAFASHALAATSAARASGFPRMARAKDVIVFAWTEAGEPSRVRTAFARVRPAAGAGGAP